MSRDLPTEDDDQHIRYNGNGPYPPRKWTQEDQDKIDEQSKRKAMKDLVQSWMDRLQLISVITTFFAAIEAQLLGITTPDEGDTASLIEQAANAGLAGALVVHCVAAIIAFLAAFFLIRYKFKEAKREEIKAEKGISSPSVSSSSRHPSDPPIWSSDPHLEQVGPFRKGQPPTHLLDRCHSLCMWLAALGFTLALVGVMCFVWARLSRSVSIFSSICMGGCIIVGVITIFS